MSAANMSATVMRKLASQGNIEEFRKGLPKGLQSDYKEVYDMVLHLTSSFYSIFSTVFPGLRSETDGFKAAVLLARQMPVSPTFPNFHSVAKARSQITQTLSSEWEEEWLSSAPTCTKLFFPDVASAQVIGALDLKP
jgi:hypothetical protein